MKLVFTFLCILSFFFSSQDNKGIIISKETNDEKQVLVYAENISFSPYTVTINAVLTEMFIDRKIPSVLVVPPKSKALILTITPNPNPKGNKYGYSLNTNSYMGDVNAKHDDDYTYTLPYKKDESYRVSQGYYGNVSHHDVKAIDFTMPIGTEVYAIRDGIVIDVKEDSNKGCPSDECLKMGNFVTILQSDNSFAEYYHLKKNGAAVHLGDKIKTGDLIGYSGATGWATGPHLHVEVYLRKKLDSKMTVDTYFNVNGKRILLKKGDKPKRN